jgi:hypothetical protein
MQIEIIVNTYKNTVLKPCIHMIVERIQPLNIHVGRRLFLPHSDYEIPYVKNPASSIERRGLFIIRQRPTLPPGLPGSTIGAVGLNFRVRNGNGCDPYAMAAEKLSLIIDNLLGSSKLASRCIKNYGLSRTDY